MSLSRLELYAPCTSDAFDYSYMGIGSLYVHIRQDKYAEHDNDTLTPALLNTFMQCYRRHKYQHAYRTLFEITEIYSHKLKYRNEYDTQVSYTYQVQRCKSLPYATRLYRKEIFK